MPESTGDLITITLALTVVWLLSAGLASRKDRGRHGGAGASPPPSGVRGPSHR
jgi:hypothetical protein